MKRPVFENVEPLTNTFWIPCFMVALAARLMAASPVYSLKASFELDYEFICTGIYLYMGWEFFLITNH
jgi:hypothetical protein